MRDDIDFFYAFPRRAGAFPVTRVGIGRSDQSLWIEVADSPDRMNYLRELQREEEAILLHDGEGHIFVELRAVIASCKSPEDQKRLLAKAERLVDKLHPNNFRNGLLAS